MPEPVGVNLEQKQVSDRFTNSQFHKRRKTWHDLITRDLPTELAPELTGDQEGLDYQTPIVQKTIFDHIDVLVKNAPRFDLQTLDPSDAARSIGREVLLWTARSWEYENEARWWDRMVAEGQVKIGVAIAWQRWHAHQQPISQFADLDLEAAEDAIVESASENSKEENREYDKSEKRQRHPFYWTDVDLQGASWLGDERTEEGPEVFFYKYTIPYAQAKTDFSKGESEKFKFTASGRMGWFGQGSTEEEWSGEKVYVTVRDGRKLDGSTCPLDGCYHAQRTITVYASTTDQDVKDEDKVSEIDSPFPGCAFHIIPGRLFGSTDPDLRYVPLVYPLYVEAAWQNYLNTLLATAARKDYSDDDLYIDMSKVPQHVQLPEGGELMTLPKPEPGSGEIGLYPGSVQRFPKTISPHLITLLEQSQQRMVDFMMNRFLSGEAYTEASNATAGAFKSQYEQAGLPFNGILAQSDRIRKRSRRFEYHAIRWWAREEPEDDQTKYYAVLTGLQDEVRTSRRGKQGETVWVSANKLERVDFDLRILTKSETLAEAEQRWYMTKDQYLAGVATPEDLVGSAGYDDVEGQLEALRADYLAEDMDPILREATKQILIKRFSLQTGFDLGAIMGQPVFPDTAPGSLHPLQVNDAPAGGGAPGDGRDPTQNTVNGMKNQGQTGPAPEGVNPGGV